MQDFSLDSKQFYVSIQHLEVEYLKTSNEKLSSLSSDRRSEWNANWSEA